MSKPQKNVGKMVVGGLLGTVKVIFKAGQLYGQHKPQVDAARKMSSLPRR